MQFGLKPPSPIGAVGTAPVKPTPPSGMEMMLKSMGLGEVIDAAKVLASGDTIGKIMKFADAVEGIDDRFSRIEGSVYDVRSALSRIERYLGTLAEGGIVDVIERRGVEYRSKPGPGPGDGGPFDPDGDV